MKGWIRSHLENSPSIALLLETCRARGHRVGPGHPKDCQVEIRGDRPPQAGAA
jgi:hypothetical protein